MNLLKIILRLFMLSLLTLMVSGCDWHADPRLWDKIPDKSWEGGLFLKLKIAEPGKDNGMSTRSMEAGDYYENPLWKSEQLQNLRVIILKKGASSNESDTIKYNRTYVSLEDISFERYEVEFSTEYIIYLIGNESGLENLIEGGVNFDSLLVGQTLDRERFENLKLIGLTENSPMIIYNEDKTGNVKKLIPMTESFEIRTRQRPETNAEYIEVTQEESFFITRVATKFTFNFYRALDYKYLDETESINIRKILIKGLSNCEFLFPKNTHYLPAKGEDSESILNGREIISYDVPEDAESNLSYTFDLSKAGSDFKISDFPVWNESNPTPDTEKVSFSPQIYFTESKGMPNETEGKNEFTCALSFSGESFNNDFFTTSETLPNLSSLPRNTHVIVNVIIGNDRLLRLRISVEPWEKGGWSDIQMEEMTED